jgi:hypothetical protein
MKKRSLLVSLILLLAFSNQAFSAYIKGARIANVHALSNGNFVIQIDTPSPIAGGAAPNGSLRCQNSGRLLHVYLGQGGVTTEGLESLYAMALTSIGLNTTVGIRFNDAFQSNGVTSSCFANEIKLND